MTISKIHIVAAFDRFNYGDILFAHISRHVLARAFPQAAIDYYAAHGGDLRDVGGVDARPVKALAGTAGPGSLIWIAGGEVLTSRWYTMYEHHLSIGMARNMKRARKYFGSEAVDRACRTWAGIANRLPWVLDPAIFRGRPPVVYNSVGGVGVGAMDGPAVDWLREGLAAAHWLSVRDRRSQAAVGAVLGAPPPLVPDSAVLMAELIPADDLAAARGRTLQAMGLAADAPYICVQCGINYLQQSDAELAAAIAAVHERHGLPVVLFAIGRAAGHEDQMVARRLASQLAGQSWLHVAPETMSMWDIMALVAGTACYVGTSLHGYITAFAFGRPRVGLSEKVTKQIAFRDDWDLASMPAGVRFADLPAAVGAAMAHEPQALAAQAAQVVATYRAAIAPQLARLGGKA